MRTLLFLAAVSALIATAPSDAEACSPEECSRGFFLPGDFATVPANLPAIYWRPTRGVNATTDPSKVVLATADAPGTVLPFTATQQADGSYLLVPQQPLTPNTAYLLIEGGMCGGFPIGPKVAFKTASAVALPNELGALAETSNKLGSLGDGGCESQIDAHQVGVGLQLGAGAMAWRDLLQFETLVDGVAWRASRSAQIAVAPGGSWQGRGVDVLYQVCKSDSPSRSEGVSAGPHEVVFRGSLPGSTTVVQSSSLTVELDCAKDWPDENGGASGGCDAGGSGAAGGLLLGWLAAIGGLRRRTARRAE
jgi:hypothetical protein